MLLFLGCDSYSGIWPFWDLSCKPGLFLGYLHLSNPWIPIFVLWKSWLLKHLLSTLDSQFLLSARFFWNLILYVNGWLRHQKCLERRLYYPLILLLCGPPFLEFVSQTPSALLAISTKPLSPQFSLRRIYCFLLRQYSSFTPIFPKCLPIYIFLPYWLLFLRGKAPVWMWNSFPCSSLLGILSPEVFSVLTAF